MCIENLPGNADGLSGEVIDVGTVVAGKYAITAFAGGGGMGKVMVAEHIHLKEKVALKFLSVARGNPNDFRARFLREAQITAKLRGDHLARLMDFGVTDGGTPYMVMEYLEGRDLRRVLQEDKRLSVELAVEYIVQACEGLAEAHARGIVHRDLKPSNLFVCKRLDGSDLIKIVDFGISKIRSAVSDGQITGVGEVLGSPRYASPEQLVHSAEVDERADIWSIAAILYELLTGNAAFSGTTTPMLCMQILSGPPPIPMSEIVSAVPRELDVAVLKCLAHSRESRTPDIGELVRDIGRTPGMESLIAVADDIRQVLEQRPRLQAEQSGGYDALTANGERSVKQLGLGTTGSFARNRHRVARAPADASGRGLPCSSAAPEKEAETQSPAPTTTTSRRAAWVIASVSVLIGIGIIGLRHPERPLPGQISDPSAVVSGRPMLGSGDSSGRFTLSSSSPSAVSSLPHPADSESNTPSASGSSRRGHTKHAAGHSSSPTPAISDPPRAPASESRSNPNPYDDRY